MHRSYSFSKALDDFLIILFDPNLDLDQRQELLLEKWLQAKLDDPVKIPLLIQEDTIHKSSPILRELFGDPMKIAKTFQFFQYGTYKWSLDIIDRNFYKFDRIKVIARVAADTFRILQKATPESLSEIILNIFFSLTSYPEGRYIPLRNLIDNNLAKEYNCSITELSHAVEGILYALFMSGVKFPLKYHPNYSVFETSKINFEIFFVWEI